MIVRLALDVPLPTLFDYVWDAAQINKNEADINPLPPIGQLALVEWGRRKVVGLVVEAAHSSNVPEHKLKPVLALLETPTPLSKEWLALVTFAADYYHRPLGEVALPALPKGLRIADIARQEQKSARAQVLAVVGKNAAKNARKVSVQTEEQNNDISLLKASAIPAKQVQLNLAQQQALDAICHAQGFMAQLLFGVTGSGKTEVYLHAVDHLLTRDATAQALLLIPEINLTPQLEALFRARFPLIEIAILHSGLAEGVRLKNWLAAHNGRARIVLGTRLAALASVPHLKMIIIDEEHDPSFKQQEGLRYSARDLAVWRAHQLQIPIVLGSATPSLESWWQASRKKYARVDLPQRAVTSARLPTVRIINLAQEKAVEGLTPSAQNAIRLRLAKGEQSLLFLNRRGYAPVISCGACGYVCQCTRCSAYMVWHKADARLHCHHCGLEARVPKACPTCGNMDLSALGRGTQRIEESLQSLFPQARVARIDADSTRRKGTAQKAFEAVHAQEVDILVGTQMVAKGHDFKNLTLVVVLNPDAALFSADYRASERLFAQLMQVAGRAGRAQQAGEVLVQTRYPDHPLFVALQKHDYAGFARALLHERKGAHLPPFVHQAMLRAEAQTMPEALQFLRMAAEIGARVLFDSDKENQGDTGDKNTHTKRLDFNPQNITLCDAVPMSMARLSNDERAQLLVESASRPALQAFIKVWLKQLQSLKNKLHWHIEIDPAEI